MTTDTVAHFTLVTNPDGESVLDLSQASDSALRELVYDVLTDIHDIEEIDGMGHRYALSLVARAQHQLTPRLKDEKVPEVIRLSFLGHLTQANAQIERVFQQRLKDGMVDMDNVHRLFPEGSEVVFLGEQPVGGRVVSIKAVKTFFSSYVEAKLQVIHGVHGHPQPGVYRAVMPGFSGTRAIASLPLRALDAARKAELSRRGEAFLRHVAAGSYAQYAGILVQDNWWGSTSFQARGRVVLDPISFRRLSTDQWTGTQRACGIENVNEDNHDPSAMAVPEDKRWMCMPWLYGFSMAAKRWGRMAVADMSAIQWREDAFDKVVMPADQKPMIHALVKHHGHGLGDLIDGKSGGCIFLLHGEPGVGKTLIAESVAEVLHKPLYAVSVGELGTDPSELETRLRAILEVATTWDAVILLDEADIFLEARDQQDVARNAMVGVFLRLLEYHNGVLFMTTNRVRNIDRAFYSRISVALRFEAADTAKRTQIWHNLLELAGLDVAWAVPLGEHALNGRQVKNCIRLAQTLAISQDRAVVLGDLERAVSQTLSFEQTLLEGTQPHPPSAGG